jgi:hypothetical protein
MEVASFDGLVSEESCCVGINFENTGDINVPDIKLEVSDIVDHGNKIVDH